MSYRVTRQSNSKSNDDLIVIDSDDEDEVIFVDEDGGKTLNESRPVIVPGFLENLPNDNEPLVQNLFDNIVKLPAESGDEPIAVNRPLDESLSNEDDEEQIDLPSYTVRYSNKCQDENFIISSDDKVPLIKLAPLSKLVNSSKAVPSDSFQQDISDETTVVKLTDKSVVKNPNRRRSKTDRVRGKNKNRDPANPSPKSKSAVSPAAPSNRVPGPTPKSDVSPITEKLKVLQKFIPGSSSETDSNCESTLKKTINFILELRKSDCQLDIAEEALIQSNIKLCMDYDNMLSKVYDLCRDETLPSTSPRKTRYSCNRDKENINAASTRERIKDELKKQQSPVKTPEECRLLNNLLGDVKESAKTHLLNFDPDVPFKDFVPATLLNWDRPKTKTDILDEIMYLENALSKCHTESADIRKISRKQEVFKYEDLLAMFNKQFDLQVNRNIDNYRFDNGTIEAQHGDAIPLLKIDTESINDADITAAESKPEISVVDSDLPKPKKTDLKTVKTPSEDGETKDVKKPVKIKTPVKLRKKRIPWNKGLKGISSKKQLFEINSSLDDISIGADNSAEELDTTDTDRPVDDSFQNSSVENSENTIDKQEEGAKIEPPVVKSTKKNRKNFKKSKQNKKRNTKSIPEIIKDLDENKEDENKEDVNVDCSDDEIPLEIIKQQLKIPVIKLTKQETKPTVKDKSPKTALKNKGPLRKKRTRKTIFAEGARTTRGFVKKCSEVMDIVDEEMEAFLPKDNKQIKPDDLTDNQPIKPYGDKEITTENNRIDADQNIEAPPENPETKVKTQKKTKKKFYYTGKKKSRKPRGKNATVETISTNSLSDVKTDAETASEDSAPQIIKGCFSVPATVLDSMSDDHVAIHKDDKVILSKLDSRNNRTEHSGCPVKIKTKSLSTSALSTNESPMSPDPNERGNGISDCEAAKFVDGVDRMDKDSPDSPTEEAITAAEEGFNSDKSCSSPLNLPNGEGKTLSKLQYDDDLRESHCGTGEVRGNSDPKKHVRHVRSEDHSDLKGRISSEESAKPTGANLLSIKEDAEASSETAAPLPPLFKDNFINEITDILADLAEDSVSAALRFNLNSPAIQKVTEQNSSTTADNSSSAVDTKPFCADATKAPPVIKQSIPYGGTRQMANSLIPVSVGPSAQNAHNYNPVNLPNQNQVNMVGVPNIQQMQMFGQMNVQLPWPASRFPSPSFNAGSVMPSPALQCQQSNYMGNNQMVADYNRTLVYNSQHQTIGNVHNSLQRPFMNSPQYEATQVSNQTVVPYDPRTVNQCDRSISNRNDPRIQRRPSCQSQESSSDCDKQIVAINRQSSSTVINVRDPRLIRKVTDNTVSCSETPFSSNVHFNKLINEVISNNNIETLLINSESDQMIMDRNSDSDEDDLNRSDFDDSEDSDDNKRQSFDKSVSSKSHDDKSKRTRKCAESSVRSKRECYSSDESVDESSFTRNRVIRSPPMVRKTKSKHTYNSNREEEVSTLTPPTKRNRNLRSTTAVDSVEGKCRRSSRKDIKYTEVEDTDGEASSQEDVKLPKPKKKLTLKEYIKRNDKPKSKASLNSDEETKNKWSDEEFNPVKGRGQTKRCKKRVIDSDEDSVKSMSDESNDDRPDLPQEITHHLKRVSDIRHRKFEGKDKKVVASKREPQKRRMKFLDELPPTDMAKDTVALSNKRPYDRCLTKFEKDSLKKRDGSPKSTSHIVRKTITTERIVTKRVGGDSGSGKKIKLVPDKEKKVFVQEKITLKVNENSNPDRRGGIHFKGDTLKEGEILKVVGGKLVRVSERQLSSSDVEPEKDRSKIQNSLNSFKIKKKCGNLTVDDNPYSVLKDDNKTHDKPKYHQADSKEAFNLSSSAKSSPLSDHSPIPHFSTDKKTILPIAFRSNSYDSTDEHKYSPSGFKPMDPRRSDRGETSSPYYPSTDTANDASAVRRLSSELPRSESGSSEDFHNFNRGSFKPNVSSYTRPDFNNEFCTEDNDTDMRAQYLFQKSRKTDVETSREFNNIYRGRMDVDLRNKPCNQVERAPDAYCSKDPNVGGSTDFRITRKSDVEYSRNCDDIFTRRETVTTVEKRRYRDDGGASVARKEFRHQLYERRRETPYKSEVQKKPPERSILSLMQRGEIKISESTWPNDSRGPRNKRPHPFVRRNEPDHFESPHKKEWCDSLQNRDETARGDIHEERPTFHPRDPRSERLQQNDRPPPPPMPMPHDERPCGNWHEFNRDLQFRNNREFNWDFERRSQDRFKDRPDPRFHNNIQGNQDYCYNPQQQHNNHPQQPDDDNRPQQMFPEGVNLQQTRNSWY